MREITRGEQAGDCPSPPKKGSGNSAGPCHKIIHTSYLYLDNMIHERTRLAIISVLVIYNSLSFRELKDLLGISDGNLSVHARRLERAGYLLCDKRFDGRVPRTEYSLTKAGRRAVASYVECLEPLILAIRAV